MQFFNAYNTAIPIDGKPDLINKKIDIPIHSWMLTSGDQGSFLSYIEFPDTSWQNIKLYYHDQLDGSQADSTLIDGGDTGDTLSYGDQGIIFYTSNQNKIDLRLGISAYFLPANFTSSDARQLADWTKTPASVMGQAVEYSSTAFVENPALKANSIGLLQSYPNPFNSQTTISIYVNRPANTTIEIYNIHGQLIKRLIQDQKISTSLTLRWDGTDAGGALVSSGIYFVLAKTLFDKRIHKVTVLP